MSQEDWAKKYGTMDQRVQDKYAELPSGEQIGKKIPVPPSEPNQ